MVRLSSRENVSLGLRGTGELLRETLASGGGA